MQFNMITYEVWLAIVFGSCRDPILWLVAFIFGWDAERKTGKTVIFLAVAGFIWGGIRVSVYAGRGEELSRVQGLVIIGFCVLLMVCLGAAVRCGRDLYRKKIKTTE